MRLAVFTNQFPARPTTFFAWDMRALLESGVSLDLFPLYPEDPSLWSCVPDLLSDRVLPRSRVHHLPLFGRARARSSGPSPHPVGPFLTEVAQVGIKAVRHGLDPVAKTGYAARCAWTWAHAFPAGSFDHVLAYWGNHAATTAYLYHRLTNPRIPFSMLVQARMDLYRKPVFLAEKMAYADNIFIVCEFNRGYIHDRFPAVFPRVADRIHVHHLGLDLAAIPFQPTPRPPATVIAVGRFEPLKGLDVLVRAAALLRDRGIAVRVVLVGGGDEEPALRGLAARLGLGDVVEFRGWLGSDGVFAAMREATVLAHPSIALDAMPTVLKEAIAVGTPVVASDLAGIPEILDRGRCGILVPPGDVAALAEGIGRLLADAGLRQRLASAGREHAERLFDLWRNGRALADRLRATRRHGSAAT